MRTQRPGFTVIEAVIALAVIGILGFAGWRVYDANKSDNPASGANQTTEDTSSRADTSTEFTYQPKWDDFKLTLDSKYTIIENIVGNRGGAPGMEFRVATATANSNVVADNNYTYLEVLAEQDTTTDKVVALVKTALAQEGCQNVETTTLKVDEQSAQKVSGDCIGYGGTQHVVVVTAGNSTYRIKSVAPDSNDHNLLDAVLAGISF